MENMMIDLYNDDDKHGQIEGAYRENYLFSLLRFHVLELYGNDVFRKARKIGNKIFINLPIRQQEECHYQHNYHHYRSSRNSISLLNPVGNSPQRPNNSPRSQLQTDDDAFFQYLKRRYLLQMRRSR